MQAAISKGAAVPYVKKQQSSTNLEKRGNIMNVSEVKQGDPIIFQVQEKEYNGIAMGDAAVGVHPGAKRAGIYLNLVYLNENGVVVKMLSAPALPSAWAADDLDKLVAAEIAARRHDHRKNTLVERGGDVDESTLRKELLEVPQISGWKVCGEMQYALRVSLQQKTEELKKITAERDYLKALVAKSMAPLPSAEDLDRVAEEQEAAQQTDSDGSAGVDMAPLLDHSPDGSQAV